VTTRCPPDDVSGKLVERTKRGGAPTGYFLAASTGLKTSISGPGQWEIKGEFGQFLFPGCLDGGGSQNSKVVYRGKRHK